MNWSPDNLTAEENIKRCFWCDGVPEFAAYHDTEWGYPVKDDTRLFEKICLEAFQCGLSWRTVLNKRESFREAFQGFEFEVVARFGARDVERLLKNDGIIRHRGKIEAAIHNARCAIDLIDEFGSIATFVWQFEPATSNRPRRVTRDVVKQLATTDESKRLSQQLRKRGWKFVGPTTAYAFMQAMGLVNDHTEDCDFRQRAASARKRFSPP